MHGANGVLERTFELSLHSETDPHAPESSFDNMRRDAKRISGDSLVHAGIEQNGALTSLSHDRILATAGGSAR